MSPRNLLASLFAAELEPAARTQEWRTSDEGCVHSRQSSAAINSHRCLTVALCVEDMAVSIAHSETTRCAIEDSAGRGD